MEKYNILEIINIGKDYLEKNNIESPRLVIEILLADMLNIQRIDLYSQYDKPIVQDEVSKLNEMMKRAANSEPIQHILGKVHFMNLELKINKNALIPRPETEELVSKVIERIDGKENVQNVLDIGTGSGCIALALADEYPEKNIYGVDISKEALFLAIENRDKLQSTAKFKLIDILIEQPKMKFDYIISNPPYIPKDEYMNLDENVRLFDPLGSLTDGSDGLTFYRSFAHLFKDILAPQGSFALEIGHNQKEALEEIFKEYYDVEFEKDMSGKNRFVFGKLK